MTTLSQKLKCALLLTCVTGQTISAMDNTVATYFQGIAQSFLGFFSTEKQDAQIRPLYPVEITHENSGLREIYLQTFPSFVQVTEQAAKKLQEDKSEFHHSLSLLAEFLDSSSSTIGSYSINHLFFDKIKKAGIYQPNYLIFDQNTSNVSILNTECNFECPSYDIIFGLSSYPSALKGQFVQKSPPFSTTKTNITIMSNNLPYTPSVRGITYLLDTNAQLTECVLTCHETTDDELETLTTNGELKIPIKGWPK